MSNVMTVKGLLGVASIALLIAAALVEAGPRYNRLLAAGLAALAAGIAL